MRPSTRTRERSNAARRRAPAPTVKTSPASARETSAAATNGPTRVPRLSIVEVAPFDAISSSGVRARDGNSATSAGLMSVVASPSSAAKAYTRSSASAKNAAAEPASAAEPTRLVASRKRSRRKRSPSDAAKGARTAAGNRRTSPAIPTADAPPAS
jgi:hypothetical protein